MTPTETVLSVTNRLAMNSSELLGRKKLTSRLYLVKTTVMMI